MKLGIMQPYLFPYIGYFQLIANCDLFVVHDDVQYIKGGWINRNRILINRAPHHITLPIRNDSAHLPINERCFASDFEKQKMRLLRQIHDAYGRTPFFADAYGLVRDCFHSTDDNVARFVTQTIKRCCERLAITTPLVMSSSLSKNSALQAEERVIAINKALGADIYINPIGGIELYDRENFAKHGIKLQFIRTRDFQYQQFAAPFVPSLSILDVMAFNPPEKVQDFLRACDLV
jgi:hypothetical protein